MKQNKRKGRKLGALLLALTVLLSGNGITAYAVTVGENKAMAENVKELEEKGAAPANPVHHCTKQNDGTDYTDFSYVYFGSYPQTEETDSAVIAAIERAIEAKGSQWVSDSLADGKTDVWVDGVKYRRISKSDMDNDEYFGDSNYRYFKWERIKWKVLSNNGSTLFVVADQALDWKRYNEKQENITWENCTLRNWLNSSFYNTAFSNDEQNAIVIQTVVNDKNPEYGTKGGNNTNDHIYLLSIDEVMDEAYGFCSNGDTESVSRRTKVSDFAHARGVYRRPNEGYEGNCWWWLRSPGHSVLTAALVDFFGAIGAPGTYVDYIDGAVCPALHINLSSHLWTMTEEEEPDREKVLTGIQAFKTKTVYTLGETLNMDDIKVTAYYQSHPDIELPSDSYTINAVDIDMDSPGSKILKVSYTEGSITKTAEIPITVNQKADENGGNTEDPGEDNVTPSNPVHGTNEEDGTDYTRFSYVYFGSYPQTEVTDSAVIATIEQVIETEGSEADCGTDVWVEGVNYRRISKSDASNNSDSFGDSNYRYFKWERIKWKVLSNNGSTLFVVADQALDCKRYSNRQEDITWEDCTLRSWLNSDFYNTAFSNDEQSAIVIQTVVNDKNPKYDTEGGNNTNDYVYLLSIGEAMNEDYGFCGGDYTTRAVSRQIEASDFAQVKGALRNTTSAYESNCSWWLRSPGGLSHFSAFVHASGYVDTAGFYVNGNYAVCPALHINLSSDQWTMTEEEEPEKEKVLTGIQASKTKTVYTQGDKLNVDDIKVTAYYQSHPDIELTSDSYTTNAADIDMDSPGSKILKVSYTEGSITKTIEIPITVNQKADENGGNTETPGGNTEDNVTPSNPVHGTNEEDGTDYTRFSYVYFGSYPQTEVTDSAVIAAIEKVIEAEGSEADCGTDVWVDGVKYRRISKSDVSSNNDFGDRYYRYFKWERIKWKVLWNDGSTLFVVADKGLDGKGYHDRTTDFTWESCTLRSWLNDSFYNTAFDDSEQSAIVIQNVVNDDNPEYGIEGGNNTNDHVYLLSIEEAMNEDYGFCEAVSRQIKVSDFAHAKGVFRNTNSDYEGQCGWWLRSPGGLSNCSAFVRVGGYLDMAGFYAYNRYAVCPALHINLSSDQWTMTEEEEPEKEKVLTGIRVSKTKTVYAQGETLNVDDIKVTAYYQSHPNIELPSDSYTTNAAVIDLNSPGSKILKVSYTEGSITKTADIPITVDQKADENAGNIQKPEGTTQVQSVKVTKIAITAPSKKLAAGKKVKLTVKVLPENASNKEVIWKTSNKKYATVNEKNGQVTLKRAGIGKTVTITAVARDGSGVKANYKIKIMKHAVKSIKLKAPAKTLTAGKSMKMKATVKTTGKSVNKTLKWKSSNTQYATVSKSGKVTAKKAGKGKNVTITALSTDGSGKKAKVKIKIK